MSKSEKTTMKTDDLIRLIAADAKAPSARFAPALALAWGTGFVVSIALFLVTLGFRDDLAGQGGNWRFLAKVLAAWTAVGVSAWDCLRLARPTETQSFGRLNWLVAGLIAATVLLEAATLPGSDWQKNLVGENWPYCLAFVPALALAPLIAVFVAFRNAAPASPRAAGAALGRLAAATGAGLYALHCPDDSPFFVVTWYGIAAIVVTSCAAVAGSRVLRW